MSTFEIGARAGSARAGVLHTGHGDVCTPAFVPLASHATVRGLQSSEVADLGYQMVLGNTFHLFIRPGHQHIAALGGLHEFMGWSGPIITDSGGFQVFSMGHGGVAEEIKASGGSRGKGHGGVLEITEEGVRFRSYLDGGERFMGPETSMEIQAALGSDVVLAFDECTPFHAERDYTARSTERTHRWLERCLRWRAENAAGGLFYGIVQGGTYEDLRTESARRVAEAGVDGVAVGGSLGQGKAQIQEVVGWALRELPPERPRHLLGIGDVDDVVAAVALGIDTFDCATPTRLARHGTALVPDPGARWRLDLERPSEHESREPIVAGCPCPACTEHTRAYLHYLARAKELTAVRLLALHNLTFMRALMEALRAGIEAGDLEARSEAILAGASPYEMAGIGA
ncbi:MAG: tRNA guanosine(34) transglycosylase Tgt [Thermoleophilaceae bacterium]|nr:tRNA guanosine(34) transglycosylase Tgt [Thermoleophilaceae bacterium]